jgi:mono/diheme cytochrome c family protein
MEASRVSAGISLAKAGRRLTGMAAVLFGLSFLSGCDPDPYPADLSYPLRIDLLVVGDYKEDNYAPEPLGNVETMILHMQEKDEKAVLDPTKLNPDKLSDLQAELDDLFGTPAAPTVRNDPEKPTKGIRNKQVIKDLALDEERLAAGSVLYRRHCVHCHGLTGDGRGPTAGWVHPHPRDYRRGLFKFTSVKGGGKPRREDLLRTLREGIEGTSMPNFRHLEPKQLDDMVSYVIHLSLRGEVEYQVMDGISKQPKANVRKDLVPDALRIVSKDWSDAQKDDARIVPHKYPAEYGDPASPSKESIREGFRLFNTDAACIGCHTDYGRNAPFRYDKWGTIVRPANLTAGVYRGGRRPVDIYYRIHSGIPPSNMAGTEKSILEDETGRKMWALVNFVRMLPYPKMLEKALDPKDYARIYRPELVKK